MTIIEKLQEIDKLYQKNHNLDEKVIRNNFHKPKKIKINDIKKLDVKIRGNTINYHFDKKISNLIEVYIPIADKYLYKDLELFIKYLIEYQVSFVISVSNYVTLLINNLNDLNVVLNYNNFHLEELDLFIFKINGLGLTLHYRNNYDNELSKVILRYLQARNYHRHDEEINVDEFKDFVYNCYKDTHNYDLVMIYDLLYSYLNSNNNIDVYYEKVINYQNLIELVFDSLISTRKKYETNECVVNAINMMLRNKFVGVTRTNDYRGRLKYFVNQDVIKRIIKMTVVDSDKIDNNTLSLFLKEFNNYSKNYHLIDCLIRGIKLTKGDHEILLKELLETNDYDLITRMEKSRDLIINFVHDKTLLEALNEEINKSYSLDEMYKYLMEKLDE